MYNPYAPQFVPAQRPVQQGPTVTYKDAMETLASMFPDMDRSVIDMLLKNNRGHMERTTEQLLSMGAGSGGGDAVSSSNNASATGGGESKSNNDRVVTFSEEVDTMTVGPNASASNERQRAAVSTAGAGAPPTANADPYSTGAFPLSGRLPGNFLRPPAYYKAPNTRQIMLDRDLAQYLQDREYVDRLRNDPRLYRRQHAQDRATAAGAASSSSQQASSSQGKPSEDFSAKLDRFFDFFKPKARAQPRGPEYEPLTTSEGGANDVELQTFRSSS